jgi:uncharacterized protein YukE
MTDPFSPPPGDAGGISAAAGQLHRVNSDLNGSAGKLKSAVATAVSDWRGPRTNDFRDAGAGLQAQLVSVMTGVGTVAQALDTYAKAFSQTVQDVAEYKRQADQAMTSAETTGKHLPPDSNQIDTIFQHASMRRGQLAQLAMEAKHRLHTLGVELAATIDSETDMAVPGSAKLSPAEIRRRVDSSLGVAGLQDAAATGSLTDAQAWAALAAARKAVPAKAVNDDGSVNWKEAVAEFNDNYVGPPTTLAAAAVTPSEGWALYRLLQNQRAVADDAAALRTAFSDIVGPVAYQLDQGLAGLNDVNDALNRFRNVADADAAFGPGAETPGIIRSAAAGGMPETGAIGAFGKIAGVLGVAGDVMTIVNPGLENKTEGDVMRGTAAVNIVGTGMAFSGTLAAAAGIDMAVGWVPVAGQVVMVGTGLVLAGDYVYHHWHQISNFTTHTVPHALGSAAKATGHTLASGAKKVGHFFTSIF